MDEIQLANELRRYTECNKRSVSAGRMLFAMDYADEIIAFAAQMNISKTEASKMLLERCGMPTTVHVMITDGIALAHLKKQISRKQEDV